MLGPDVIYVRPKTYEAFDLMLQVLLREHTAYGKLEVEGLELIDSDRGGITIQVRGVDNMTWDRVYGLAQLVRFFWMDTLLWPFVIFKVGLKESVSTTASRWGLVGLVFWTLFTVWVQWHMHGRKMVFWRLFLWLHVWWTVGFWWPGFEWIGGFQG